MVSKHGKVRKDLSHYLEIKYPILIFQDEDNGKTFYEAEISELSCRGGRRRTISGAIKSLQAAVFNTIA